MQITSLTIELRESYEKNPGKYVATVNYTDEPNKLVLVIDPEVSTQLLVFLGPLISKLALKSCQDLEKNITQSVEDSRAAGKLIEA